MNSALQDFADKAISFSLNSGAQYADIRAEEQNRESITIENKEIENAKKKLEKGIGIRVLKNGAWGFASITNPRSFKEIEGKIIQALKNSDYSSNTKKTKIKLYKVPSRKIKKDFPVLKNPNTEELIKIGIECNKIILERPRIIKAITNPWICQTSKYFANSEGSKILQEYTDTVIDMIATSHESGITQSVNTTEGGRGGLEMILEKNTAVNSAVKISEKASQLIDAKPTKEENARVIMNPDFVALLTHEILGHPSEADRVLGKEMAWAGGAWWKGKTGEKVGSKELNVFDDPTIKQSLGWYYFDDEGVESQRTTLIEKGILKNHMQNRETAITFDSKPTGNMRATSFMFMPLIRMACTCIAGGNWKQEEMIKDVKNGYLVSNMKIPSIDMKRYNWSISCQYAQKIENGEITELLRDVIVMGTAPEFFNSIDACGDDFTIRPITNCGKGDPMQSMIMGNGGPSIRGRATIKSVR
ncbi:TldD/PmbA family protein [Nitrosopumilus sp. K4]|uniref:TldD/PmbA family protein n=1 Tax=Nitrosopumilus sp. K4 TaxID=2795383 RepID=UPI001BA7724A|nr:TldD/PmbA family protein [Nitrosopumilus sp. K4]QUC65142.1 TldD/PmbA family protein [Nitrosopumilus sp. K4]